MTKASGHLPGKGAWLIGLHRTSQKRKYYLTNLPVATDLRTLAATIKARRICEQSHQQLKEKLWLDHLTPRAHAVEDASVKVAQINPQK
jgi:SRSO17 transposase